MNFRITTKTDCPWCDRAKELIVTSGHSYTETVFESLPEPVRKAFKTQYETVPQIFLDGERIGGYADLVEWFKNP